MNRTQSEILRESNEVLLNADIRKNLSFGKNVEFFSNSTIPVGIHFFSGYTCILISPRLFQFLYRWY